MSPKEATLKAMEEVAGPVVAIALVLSSVFFPTIFLPGITGRLYQQFAFTIAISMLLSVFNALTLSPALCSILLKPKTQSKGPLGRFYSLFNRAYKHTTEGYVKLSDWIIRKSIIGFVLLIIMTAGIFLLGKHIPFGFLPEEDQSYLYAGIQLPYASSLQRTGEVTKQVQKIIMDTPGVQSCVGVNGFNLLSFVRNTFSGFFFVTLKEWSKRNKPDRKSVV